MDTIARYTAEEAEGMRARGYEFKEFTLITDTQPMFVISAFNPPKRASEGDQYIGKRLDEF